jgi:hypothetical protein
MLIPGSSTACAQPLRSATLARRLPSGVKLTPGRMLVFAGTLSGASFSIVSSRVPARPNLRSIGTKGRASFAIRSTRRKRRR